MSSTPATFGQAQRISSAAGLSSTAHPFAGQSRTNASAQGAAKALFSPRGVAPAAGRRSLGDSLYG